MVVVVSTRIQSTVDNPPGNWEVVGVVRVVVVIVVVVVVVGVDGS